MKRASFRGKLGSLLGSQRELLVGFIVATFVFMADVLSGHG